MRKLCILFMVTTILLCLSGCGKYKEINRALDILGYNDFVIQENLGKADVLYDFADYCYQKWGYEVQNVKFDYFMGGGIRR